MSFNLDRFSVKAHLVDTNRALWSLGRGSFAEDVGPFHREIPTTNMYILVVSARAVGGEVYCIVKTWVCSQVVAAWWIQAATTSSNLLQSHIWTVRASRSSLKPPLENNPCVLPASVSPSAAPLTAVASAKTTVFCPFHSYHNVKRNVK